MDDDDFQDFIKKLKLAQVGRPLYYGKLGEPISMEDYARLFDDLEYRRVGYDEIPQTTRYVASYLSTVWLGLDHSFLGVGPPLIFETMRFAYEAMEVNEFIQRRKFHKVLEFPDPEDKPGEYLEQLRYHTEEQARIGHRAIVRLIQELEMQ
jgi:hypothetical protein